MAFYKIEKFSPFLLLLISWPGFACENFLSEYRLSALTSADQKVVVIDKNDDLTLLNVGDVLGTSIRLDQVLESRAILSCIQVPDKKIIWHYGQGFDRNHVEIMDVSLPNDKVLSAIQD